MEEMNGFTVCVLLFGDHPDLTERCLRSIVQRADWTLIKDIRIACNAVSVATATLVDSIVAGIPSEVPVRVYATQENRFKYPMMGRMLYDNDNPVVTQFIMWFDDDSYIDPSVNKSWWSDVYRAAQKTAVTGAIYRISPRGSQLANIQDQDWYNDISWPPGYRFRFATGGWWVAKTRFLKAYNYPFPELIHNGGDVMLGELCRQQGETIASFIKGIHINADASGRNSSAPRRGVSQEPAFSRTDMPLANWDFELFCFDPRQLTPEPSQPPIVADQVADSREYLPSIPEALKPKNDKLIRLPGF